MEKLTATVFEPWIFIVRVGRAKPSAHLFFSLSFLHHPVKDDHWLVGWCALPLLNHFLQKEPNPTILISFFKKSFFLSIATKGSKKCFENKKAGKQFILQLYLLKTLPFFSKNVLQSGFSRLDLVKMAFETRDKI